ncbi:MAG: MFS transporter [Bacteroidia bacterium]|nr:MFS transporter [Bacteroidia bacterium]
MAGLSDRVGPFWIQVVSLVLGGVLFLFMPLLQSFWTLLAGILVISVVVEGLRPANSASVAMYSRPENRTRAFSLNRMAINLGFALGPALAGVLASLSYRWLFLADGLTCIAAGTLFFFYFRRHPMPRVSPAQAAVGLGKSPYRDTKFWLLFSCVFPLPWYFSMISTLPLYYREVHHLSELNIGLLLGLNGLIVFILEMILVYLLEKRFKIWQLVVFGNLLNGLAFLVLNLSGHSGILYLSMLFLSLAEILAMPFMMTFILQQAGDHNRGAYLGLYTLSFSAAFTFAPLLGTQLADAYGFANLWWVMVGLTLLTSLGFYLLMPRMVARF